MTTPLIQGGFTIIAVEKARPSAKHPADFLNVLKAAILVLRPHSNRTNTPAPKAAADAQNDGFLREVDEALREQEMLSAIRRYGIPVGLAIFAALLALAGYLWWEHTRKIAEGERGEQLTIALDRVEAGQLDAAKAPLAALADRGEAGDADGNKTAAQLLQAGILVEQGKPAEAQKAFAAVAADATAPQPYRDLATLREVALGFDTLPADQAVAKLKPLAVPGKPFFGSAGELLGAAYIKQGRNELAGPLFAAISRDKTVPVSLQRRARQMAGLLGVDAIDDVNEAANGGANGAPAPAAQ